MARRSRAITIRGVIPDLSRVTPAIKRRAMPDVVEAVTESAKREAPKKRGTSSPRSIVSKIRGRTVKMGAGGVVTSYAPHSHLIEKGTDPHNLAPLLTKTGRKRKKSKLAMTIYGSQTILRKSAEHGGSRANPYMERAIPRAEHEIDRILQREGDRALREAIGEGVSKVGDVVRLLT